MKKPEKAAQGQHQNPRKLSAIPMIGEAVKLSEINVSRRPQSILPQLAAQLKERLGMLVKGEALPVENISPSQRTQLVKLLTDGSARFTHGYNTEKSTLYLWVE